MRIIFIAFLLVRISLFAQTEVVKELNSIIIPISDDTNAFSIPEDLRISLANKQIVGLGEATHGTKEFFIFKHNMIKYLVTELNYKVFIIEGGFSGSTKMNDYICNNTGDINTALIGVGIAAWMRTEFVETIEFLKEYNSSKTEENKVRFYGADMQASYPIIESIKSKLSQIDSTNTDIQNELDSVKLIFKKTRRSNISKQENEYILAIINNVTKVFSETDICTNINNYCLTVLKQTLEYHTIKGSRTRAKLRNKYMAENSLWIYNNENKRKAIIWAHNAHLSKKESNQHLYPQGQHIAEAMGDKYFLFGLAFNSGEINGGYNKYKKEYIYNTVPPAKKGSYDNVFSQCKTDNFILYFNRVDKNSELYKFLNTNNYSYQLSSYASNSQKGAYCKHNITKSYDALVFFKKSHASTNMHKKQ